jgi:hypothetical protein
MSLLSNGSKVALTVGLCALQFPVKPGEASQPLAPWVTRFEFNPTTKKACITFAINSPDTVFYQVRCVNGLLVTGGELPTNYANPACEPDLPLHEQSSSVEITKF